MMNIQKPEVPINPLVTSLKMKHGVKEKITPNSSGGLDLIIQQLLYSPLDKKYLKLKIQDYNPLVLILVVIEEGNVYKLFDIPFKSEKVSGIYGLNLNLMIADNQKNLEILTKIKDDLLTHYQSYILPTTTDKLKIDIIKQVKAIIQEIQNLHKTGKVFLQNPFHLFETKYILYSSSINTKKQIDSLKNFHPKVFETKDVTSTRSDKNKT